MRFVNDKIKRIERLIYTILFMIFVIGIPSISFAELFRPEPIVTGGSSLVYIEIPEDMSVSEFLSQNETVVKRMAILEKDKIPSYPARSLVIVHTKNGIPILPDLEKAVSSCKYAGKCTFSDVHLTFDEASFSSWPEGKAIIQELFNIVYPWMKQHVGDPAFNIEVTVILGAGSMYRLSTNRIEFYSSVNPVAAFFHELIHAFSDDLMPGYNQVNEGMAEFFENEIIRYINDKVCSSAPGTYPNTESHIGYGTANCGYESDPYLHDEWIIRYFENLNKKALADIYFGDIEPFGGYPSMPPFTDLGLSAFGPKGYHGYDRMFFELFMANDTFIADINEHFYEAAIKYIVHNPIHLRPDYYVSVPNLFVPLYSNIMVDRASGTTLKVEGKPFDEWFETAHIINMKGTPGYNLMIGSTNGSDFTNDNMQVFYNAIYYYYDTPFMDRVVTEEMYQATQTHPITITSKLWNDTDYNCFSGTATSTIAFPSTNPVNSENYYLAGLCTTLPSTAGRLVFTASVDSPEGIIADISYRNFGATGEGLFGVIANRDTGTITASWASGTTNISTTTTVVNGVFSFDNLGIGTYYLEFSDSVDSNWKAAKTVSKDFAGYHTVLTATSAMQPLLIITDPDGSAFASQSPVIISGVATNTTSPELVVWDYTSTPSASWTIALTPNASGVFSEPVALSATGPYIIELKSNELNTATQTQRIRVFMDNLPPQISTSSFNPNGILSMTSNTLSVIVADHESGLDAASISLQIDSGPVDILEPLFFDSFISSTEDSTDSIQLSYYSTYPFRINATHTVNVSLIDRSGNTATNSWSFIIKPVATYTFSFNPGWNMIGLPLFFASDTIADNTDFSLIWSDFYEYQADIENYIGATNTLFSPLTATHGYVFYASSPGTITLNNVSFATPVSSTDTIRVPLEPGFNLMNPVMDGSIWSGTLVYAKVAVPSGSTPTYPVEYTFKAQRQGWISDAVYSYSATDGFHVITSCYRSDEPLRNTSSYWVFATDSASIDNVSLIFGGRSTQSGCSGEHDIPSTANDWSYRIRAEFIDRGFGDEIIIGDKSGASNGLDFYDARKPPEFPVNATHPIYVQNIMSGANYSIDFRAPDSFDSNGTKIWPFLVNYNTSAATGTINLSFETQEPVPASMTLMLRDLNAPVDQQYTYITPATSTYSFDVSSATGTRAFEVILSKGINGGLASRLIMDGHPADTHGGILVEACNTTECSATSVVATTTTVADGNFVLHRLPTSSTSPATYTIRFSTDTYIQEFSMPGRLVSANQITPYNTSLLAGAILCVPLDADGNPTTDPTIACLRGGNAEFGATDTLKISLRTDQSNIPEYYDWTAGTSTYIYDLDHIYWHLKERNYNSSRYWTDASDRADINKDGLVDVDDYALFNQMFQIGCNETTCGERCILAEGVTTITDCGVNDPLCNFNCLEKGGNIVSWRDLDFNDDNGLGVQDVLAVNSCRGLSVAGGANPGCLAMDIDGSLFVDTTDLNYILSYTRRMCDYTTCDDLCILEPSYASQHPGARCGVLDTTCNTHCATEWATNTIISWKRAASIDHDTNSVGTDLDDLQRQLGNVDWATDSARADINDDGQVDGADFELLKQPFGCDLNTTPGDACNQDNCLLADVGAVRTAPCATGALPLYFNPDTLPAGQAQCARLCGRSYVSGEILRFNLANLTGPTDAAVDVSDFLVLRKRYMRGFGSNAREGFERVNWFLDGEFSLEDYLRFLKGRQRCGTLQGISRQLCTVCDDDITNDIDNCE